VGQEGGVHGRQAGCARHHVLQVGLQLGGGEVPSGALIIQRQLGTLQEVGGVGWGGVGC
jgi:hypothetical protein